LRILFDLVMPGLVPGIHVLAAKEVVDGRVKPGHNEIWDQVITSTTVAGSYENA
jgi:hypothetical protein